MRSVTDQLRQVAGVAPSTDWLNECYAALQNPAEGRSPHITFEMALEQLLYHDLRDVVRNFSSDENHSASEADMSPNAALLRKAIDESKQNDCRKKDLSSSFRLLLQVEEICDVSKNSEARLTNDSRCTAGSCRKFCCVDGHLPPSPLLAIEISPIVKAGGVLLPPGTKVLLTGPMTVRHGIMGWHAGNVLVLGGQVERLVQIQEQELQKRIKSSGHGIDPTIRALIWKQNDEHLRNEEDEGTAMVEIGTTWFFEYQLTCFFDVLPKMNTPVVMWRKYLPESTTLRLQRQCLESKRILRKICPSRSHHLVQSHRQTAPPCHHNR
jgi:RecQ mediated genome instability protein